MCIHAITLHLPLTSSADDHNTKAYKKIITKWNSNSWQYGPMYKVVDRKMLIDAIFKDIRSDDNEDNQKCRALTAITLLTPIADAYNTKPEHKKIIESVQNYIQTTFAPDPLVTPLATNKLTPKEPFMQTGKRINPHIKTNAPALDEFVKCESPIIPGSCTEKVQRLYPLVKVQDHIKTINNSGKRTIVERNLRYYRTIHNVQGDGNCGYRAFLGSIFINCLDSHDFSGVQKLQTILQEQFIPLFTKYAGQQNHPYKLAVPTPNDLSPHTELNYTPEQIQAIHQSMMQFLTDIQNYNSIDQIEELFNKHPKFDFFMIMFLRALIAEELSKKERETERMIAISTRFEDENKNETPPVTNILQRMIMFLRTLITKEVPNKDEILYFENLLQWKTWIDQPELAILNEITEININLIQKDASKNPLTSWPSKTYQHSQADMLFVDNNHYQILRRK